MTYIDYFKLKEEITVFLRNADIFTTTNRGVTTTTAGGTFTATSSLLIAKSDVRNIRSIVVAGVTLTYGEDYQTDYYYLSTTRQTNITFTTAQTGIYVVTYDYGTDKIYPDFPQTSLSVSDFPRIGVDLVGVQTQSAGLGNVNRSNVLFTVVMYSTSKTELLNLMTSVRSKFIDAVTGFYYVGRWVKPGSTGPLIVGERGKDKVFQQNVDFEAPLRYEIN